MKYSNANHRTKLNSQPTAHFESRPLTEEKRISVVTFESQFLTTIKGFPSESKLEGMNYASSTKGSSVIQVLQNVRHRKSHCSGLWKIRGGWWREQLLEGSTIADLRIITKNKKIRGYCGDSPFSFWDYHARREILVESYFLLLETCSANCVLEAEVYQVLTSCSTSARTNCIHV